MAQLATIASVAATAAGVAGNIMQDQANRKAQMAQAAQRQAEQQARQQAQAAADQQQQQAREDELQVQAAERARQRKVLLERTIASTRARLAASGASPDSGSGRALIDGMRDDTEQAQDADEQQLAARLAAGRRSLLDSSGQFTSFTRASRSISSLASGLRSLLDIF